MMSEEPQFYLLPLEGGNTKAIFLVPDNLSAILSQHPILCRGASFKLRIDDEVTLQDLIAESVGDPPCNSHTSFLSVVFYSPTPEETAAEIWKRLQHRVAGGENHTNGIANMFAM